MDDRAAVAAIALCLEELARRRHAWDVYAVATVQEEAPWRGAVTGAYGIEPTLAVAVDVTFGMQPGLSPQRDGEDGRRPEHRHRARTSTPCCRDRLAAAAKALEIPHQVEAIAGASGTDAWAIQVSRSGVPCGLLGIPVRSMHTPVETVCLRDIERTAKLLAEFISRLAPGFADTLVLRGTRSAVHATDARAAERSLDDAAAEALGGTRRLGPRGGGPRDHPGGDPRPRGRVPRRRHGQPHRPQEGHRRLGGLRVLAAAHMDEVGLMITQVEDTGLLRFAKVGGIDDRVLPAARRARRGRARARRHRRPSRCTSRKRASGTR